jgi:hypothetical protein
MATHVQHEIGNPTRLIPTDSRRIRSTPVSAVGARPKFVASPPEVPAPQYRPQDLGFLESARMDREMAREMGRRSQRSQKSAMSITAALLNMSTQRFVVLAAGLLLVLVGLLALRFAVFLSDFDQWGFQINCGSGFQSSLTQAGIADSAGTHFVDQCRTAIAMRRAWTIPVAVTGALLLSALLVRPPSTRQAAGLLVSTDGADGAATFDGAIAPASGAFDARTASARNATQCSPAPAA